MKRTPSRSGLSIAMCALMMTGCASSIEQRKSPMARVSASAMAEPPQLPKVQRSADGTQTGSQALNSQLELYDIGGSIRAQLIELQCSVMAAMGEPMRRDCPRLALPGAK